VRFGPAASTAAAHVGSRIGPAGAAATGSGQGTLYDGGAFDFEAAGLLSPGSSRGSVDESLRSVTSSFASN
jgi:hypothetical protein